MPHNLTLAQAAALLSCSEARVLELIAAGLLEQNAYGIPLAQVAEYLSSHGAPSS